jgi:hypothetical protein
MAGDRSRYGLVVSALGAIVLAVSVFLPWYGVSFTTAGIGFVQQVGNQVATQFGNASMQAYVGGLHTQLAGLAGTQFTAVSAHQVLHVINIVLLILAGLALLDALFPLARAASVVPDGAGGSVAVLGTLAALCVLYRMFDPPVPAGGMISLSLREGAWLALLGSFAMILGGLWPRCLPASSSSEEPGVHGVFAGLSGWTPGS